VGHWCGLQTEKRNEKTKHESETEYLKGATELMITVEINAKLTWAVFQDRKSKYWIAVCDDLKISLQDKTLPALVETIEDSIQGLFLDLVRTREFDVFLRKHGWNTESPLPKRTTQLRFDVPYTLNKGRRNDFEGAIC